MATPKIVIGENIHTWLPANVFKGKFEGNRTVDAIHKYIEIYDERTIDNYKASLEIYKSLECENICKLLEWVVENPVTDGLPDSDAWTTARTNWEIKMEEIKMEDEKILDVRRDKWRAWRAWKTKKEDLAKMEKAAETEWKTKKEDLAEMEKAAETEAKTNNLAWFNMRRTKIRITMEDCGTELLPMTVHHIMSKLESACFINTLLQIAYDVLSAIILLNKNMLVHGDIKVENVVLSELKAPEAPAPSPPAAVGAAAVAPAPPAPSPAPSLPQQDTALCPMIKAKLIDMDSIGYIDAKKYTHEDTHEDNMFTTYFHIENVLYNVPASWVEHVSSRMLHRDGLANFRKNLTDRDWDHSKGYIDIFSWCIVCLHLLRVMGMRHFYNIKDKKEKKSSFKNSVPDKLLSKSLEFVKAYIFESLISDMCLPDIKIGDTPMDKSLTDTVIDVKYCEKVKLFLLWLKSVNNIQDIPFIPFPEKKRKKWWVEFKIQWWSRGWFVVVVGQPMGGGYNKSNRCRDTRKNKRRLSKRLKKRKYKRTHKRKYKRKYKRTHKRKYNRTHKRKY
jgi:hypothetical protein